MVRERKPKARRVREPRRSFWGSWRCLLTKGTRPKQAGLVPRVAVSAVGEAMLCGKALVGTTPTKRTRS